MADWFFHDFRQTARSTNATTESTMTTGQPGSLYLVGGTDCEALEEGIGERVRVGEAVGFGTISGLSLIHI